MHGKYKYWFTRKDVNNEKRRATYLGYTWWWLPSPGRKQVKAIYIQGDGIIGIQGNNALKCNLSGVYHPVNNDVRGGATCLMDEPLASHYEKFSHSTLLELRLLRGDKQVGVL